MSNFGNIEPKVKEELSRWNSRGEIEDNYSQWNPRLSSVPEAKNLCAFLEDIEGKGLVKEQYLTPPQLNYDSRFINLEGIDNSGKTTCINYIKDNILSNYVLTTEPTENFYVESKGDNSWIGKQVRNSIKDDSTDPLVVFYLFLADHVNHLINTIYPAILEGKDIICDRYIFSRYAYQSVSLESYFGDDTLKYLQNIQERGFWTVMPTKTIYIDITAEESIGRMEGAENRETFEKKKFLKKARQNYISLSNEYDDIFTTINGMTEKEEVFNKLEDILS